MLDLRESELYRAALDVAVLAIDIDEVSLLDDRGHVLALLRQRAVELLMQVSDAHSDPEARGDALRSGRASAFACAALFDVGRLLTTVDEQRHQLAWKRLEHMVELIDTTR